MRDDLDDAALERTAPIELRFVSPQAEEGTVEGWAAIFAEKTVDGRASFAPGAFRRGLEELAAQGMKPSFLFSHDPGRPIGRITRAVEDQKGLRFAAALNLETVEGRTALSHLRAGDLQGVSIGYQIRQTRKDAAGETVITDALVLDISLVPVPANLSARVTAVRAITSERELAELLRKGAPLHRGLAKAVARAAWPKVKDAAVDEGADDLLELAKSIRGASKALRSSTKRFSKG